MLVFRLVVEVEAEAEVVVVCRTRAPSLLWACTELVAGPARILELPVAGAFSANVSLGTKTLGGAAGRGSKQQGGV